MSRTARAVAMPIVVPAKWMSRCGVHWRSARWLADIRLGTFVHLSAHRAWRAAGQAPLTGISTVLQIHAWLHRLARHQAHQGARGTTSPAAYIWRVARRSAPL